jgi:phytoene desaturase
MKMRVRKAEPSVSGFVIMLGVDKTFEKLAHHTIFFSDNYQREFVELFHELKPSEKPTIYISNTSSTDPEDAPDGMSNLFILVNAPYLTSAIDWEALKDGYAAGIIKKLGERGLPDLENHILFQSLITPSDFFSKFSSNKGSIYGTSSNSRLSAFRRPRNKSRKIRGLYLVGGSTHPGGGIPLAVLSAMHAVELFGRS